MEYLAARGRLYTHNLIGPFLKRHWFPSLSAFIKEGFKRSPRWREFRLRQIAAKRRSSEWNQRDKIRYLRQYQQAKARLKRIIFLALRKEYFKQLDIHNQKQRQRRIDWYIKKIRYGRY